MLASVFLTCLLTPGEPEPRPSPIRGSFKELKAEPSPERPAPLLVSVSVIDGDVMVDVWRIKAVQTTSPGFIKGKEGKYSEVEMRTLEQIPVQVNAPLRNVKELTITTVNGKKLTAEEAEKLLTDGCVVVISADGNPVDAKYLKALKEDVLILVSPEFVKNYGRLRLDT